MKRIITKTKDSKGRNVYTIGKVTATIHKFYPETLLLGNRYNITGKYGTIAVIDGNVNIPHEIDATDKSIEKILLDYRAATLTLIAGMANIQHSVRGYWTDLQKSNTDADYKIQRIKAGQTNKVKYALDYWALNWIGIDTERPDDWNPDED